MESHAFWQQKTEILVSSIQKQTKSSLTLILSVKPPSLFHYIITVQDLLTHVLGQINFANIHTYVCLGSDNKQCERQLTIELTKLFTKVYTTLICFICFVLYTEVIQKVSLKEE